VFLVNVDTSDLNFLKELEKTLNDAAKQVNRDLAQMTYGKAVELASERLHSRRQMFIDGLSTYEEDGVWVLHLDASVGWIEDGMPEHNMLDDLLSSPKAKTAADGSTYVTIPFHHGPGKGKGSTTQAQQDLISTLKTEMKKKNIPWAKIEKDENGKPKLGKLHSFDVMNAPIKSHHGPGQGRGPIGDVRQGPNARQAAGGGPGGGGTPFLQGVGVYQKEKGGKVQKSIMTFRIASSKHRGQDRWQHPGIEGTNILADSVKWAQEQIEEKIAPRLMDKIDAIIG